MTPENLWTLPYVIIICPANIFKVLVGALVDWTSGVKHLEDFTRGGDSCLHYLGGYTHKCIVKNIILIMLLLYRKQKLAC